MRKLNDKLITRLKDEKDLKDLLEVVKADRELSFEIRTGGKAIIYYNKGKLLELTASTYNFDKKYFIRKKSESLPCKNIKDYISNRPKEFPKDYVLETKKIIQGWWNDGNMKYEFETQQKITNANRDESDEFFIVDIEYRFAQNNIKKVIREKGGTFDLVGIEKKTNKIIFFELKRGLKASVGKSGIENHIKDFNDILFSKNNGQIFRNQLKDDFKNISTQKNQLGLIKYQLPELSYSDFELIFIYAFENEIEIENYKRKFDEILNAEKIQTMFINIESLDMKLSRKLCK